MPLQGFHLSQGAKKVTYVWADDQSQHLHDKLVQSAEPDQAPGLDSDQPADPPASLKSITSRQLNAASLSGGKQEAKREKAEADVQHVCRAHNFQAKQGRLQQKHEAPKAIHVQLSIDGLSEETVAQMLAVHLRTRRRAESLIDRVQTLRTGCRDLLDAMPQHVLAET